MAAPALTCPTSHPLARTLWPHLVEDVLRDMRLAVAVALLADAGLDEAEIALRTGADPVQLRAAWRRLERVAPAISRELRGRHG